MLKKIKSLFVTLPDHEFENYSDERLLSIIKRSPDSNDAVIAEKILENRRYQKGETRANLSLVISVLAMIIAVINTLINLIY